MGLRGVQVTRLYIGTYIYSDKHFMKLLLYEEALLLGFPKGLRGGVMNCFLKTLRALDVDGV